MKGVHAKTTTTTTGTTASTMAGKAGQRRCPTLRINSLGMFVFGVCGTSLQCWVLIQNGPYLLEKVWDHSTKAEWPSADLQLALSLFVTSALLLPLVLIAACFKVSNLGNDGEQLGQKLRNCPVDDAKANQTESLTRAGSLAGAIWRHMPPLAPLLLTLSGLASSYGHLVVEGLKLKDGSLPASVIWQTDLDFLWTSVHNQAEMSPSVQLTSLTLALLFGAVRSANVVWGANKWLGFLFFIQLLANHCQIVVILAGTSALYKSRVLATPDSFAFFLEEETGLLLDSTLTLTLSVLTVFLLLLSACPLHLYALHRASTALNEARKANQVRLPQPRSSVWSCFPQLSSAGILLSLGVCETPLLHDFSRLYNATQQNCCLAPVVSGIVHACLWILCWLILSVRTRWHFRFRIAVGKHSVNIRQTSLVMLADLKCVLHSKATPENEALLSEPEPMIVLIRNRAILVADAQAQRRISEIMQPFGNVTSPVVDRVYWPQSGRGNSRNPSSPQDAYSPTQDNSASSTSSSSQSHSEHSASVDDWLPPPPDDALLAQPVNTTPCVSFHVKGALKRGRRLLSGGGGDDDGDYATLRDLPLVSLPEEDTPQSSSEHLLRTNSSDNYANDSSASSDQSSGFKSGSESRASSSAPHTGSTSSGSSTLLFTSPNSTPNPQPEDMYGYAKSRQEEQTQIPPNYPSDRSAPPNWIEHAKQRIVTQESIYGQIKRADPAYTPIVKNVTFKNVREGSPSPSSNENFTNANLKMDPSNPYGYAKLGLPRVQTFATEASVIVRRDAPQQQQQQHQEFNKPPAKMADATWGQKPLSTFAAPVPPGGRNTYYDGAVHVGQKDLAHMVGSLPPNFTRVSAPYAPYNSLPQCRSQLATTQNPHGMSQLPAVPPHSVHHASNYGEERRPLIQACLMAGQGVPSSRP